MTITELSIKRPTLIVVIFSFLSVLGIFGYTQLKYDLMPKMTVPYIIITTIYPGASPNEVESTVTKVIEDACSGVNNVVAIRSNSSESRSFVNIELEMSANVDFALQDVQRKINEIGNKLPNDVQKPIISKLAFDELPVLRMAVRSKLYDKEFYQFMKDKVQPALSKIGGVGLITMSGGQEREIKINVDAQKIRNYGLSFAQVAMSVRSSNLDIPTGRIKEDGNQYVVRVAGKFSSFYELQNLIVGKSRQGTDIKLGEIAEILDGTKELETVSRLNGVNSIGVTIQKQSDANTVEVSEKVRKALQELEKTYATIGLKFDIAQDGSTFIMDSANAVKEDLVLAIILVAFVMLVFLHSLRNSLIVLVAIPSSLISTFFLMYIFDFSLNLMTLLGMSLVIGILVDDSIVVLENIYRHLEMKENQRDAALKGRNEIGFAALSITMVDVVVFVPLALITGIIGNFLRQYALVVVFSTLMSLFVSFTITPMLASRFTKLEHFSAKSLMGRFAIWFENKFNRLIDYYSATLKWSLRHPTKIVILSFGLFFASFFLMSGGFIGFEFIPQVDRGEITVNLEMAPGVSIEQNNQLTLSAEKLIREMPEVDKVLASVGTASEGMIGQTSNNNSELTVRLIPKNQRKEATDVISQRMKKVLAQLPGVKVRTNPVSLMGTNTRAPIQLLVTGPSFEDANKGAKQIAEVIKSIQGTTDVRLSSEDGKPELNVKMDRKKMSDLGLSVADVGQNLRIALTGDDNSKYSENNTDYSMRIILDRFDRSDISQVSSLTFMNNKGQQIELKQFADITQSTGPTKLERENRITSINVFSQVYGKTSGIVANEIKQKLSGVTLPDGVTWAMAGEQKTMMESMISLVLALFAGILFVYMIMVALYDSFLYPFVVLFSIPMAVVGAFLALALTMKSISIYSMLGLIMLIGLVAKNAILLVDRTNQMRKENNLSLTDALIEAGQTRLRPILMTTFTMIMGMLPIAISTAAGSEAKSGLATVLIGGLSSSLLLTLVLVPVVYVKLEGWKEKAAKLFTRLFPKGQES